MLGLGTSRWGGLKLDRHIYCALFPRIIGLDGGVTT